MKKRNLIKMIIIALILISILGAVMWYSKSINKLLLIENIKQAINEENNITTIDVTGIELGIETEHEHVYKTMYDEEKHWEECTICNEKRNEVVHSFKTTWAAGSESCYRENYYTKACTCGYSYIGHKPCVWDGKSYIMNKGYSHEKNVVFVKKEYIIHII